MAISRSLRFQILRRDNHTCQYCGRTPPEVKLTVDHVVPEALGGRDEPENLVAACADCNGGKAATPPDAERVAIVSGDAIRWAQAMKSAADQMLQDHQARQDDRDAFEQAWLQWGRGEGNHRQTMPLPPDWPQAVDRFRAAGLPLEILLYCIPPAMAKTDIADDRRFNYLCGVAWNRVTELQDAARQRLGAERDAPKPAYEISERDFAELVLRRLATPEEYEDLVEDAKKLVTECPELGIQPMMLAADAAVDRAATRLGWMREHLPDRHYERTRNHLYWPRLEEVVTASVQ